MTIVKRSENIYMQTQLEIEKTLKKLVAIKFVLSTQSKHSKQSKQLTRSTTVEM